MKPAPSTRGGFAFAKFKKRKKELFMTDFANYPKHPPKVMSGEKPPVLTPPKSTVPCPECGAGTKVVGSTRICEQDPKHWDVIPSRGVDI